MRPDILLRDYARCAIDFINQCTPIDGINIKKIEPPYGVNFNFNQCPKRETVESKYHLDETMGLIRRLFLLKIKYLVVWKPNTVMEYVVMEILGDILLKHICVAGKIVRAIAHPS